MSGCRNCAPLIFSRLPEVLDSCSWERKVVLQNGEPAKMGKKCPSPMSKKQQECPKKGATAKPLMQPG